MLGVSETTCAIAGRCVDALAQTVATIAILTSLFHMHSFQLHGALKHANINYITLDPSYVYSLLVLWHATFW
jgi:hypothetical protein